ncbi:MAG TPA: phosphopantetheine-binding protein, partial [Ktedonobacteraceae bacterium]|nr:phosphopantetheine-binding protein [Ktedonobacteraceae bacterium]
EKPERAVQEGHTAVQEVLAGIWSEVLGVSRVGLDDNFFEVGGHSLLSTRVAARVYDAFQVELPLRSLFEKTTVSEQAALLLHNPDERARIEKTAQLLVMLAQLSDDEVDAMTDGTMLASQEG